MFAIVICLVYLDHLKFCVVCVYGRKYACCGECYVVSNACGQPTSCIVQPIVGHCCEVMYFGCFDFRGELGFLNCDDELLLSPFMLTCSMMRFLSLLLLGLCACSAVVVFGRSVKLSWVWLLR